ncbi:hypothetical protein V6N12_023613 [Hibiscus sabdariffa]|uniref:Uncharacterized protein n=1 Tax=Hibiscus sabdariffa TaxID=183260 RepID=A0ABR2FY67_9ROSI
MSGPTLEVENIFSYMVQLELVQCNDFYPRRDTKHVGTNSGGLQLNGLEPRDEVILRIMMIGILIFRIRVEWNCNTKIKLLKIDSWVGDLDAMRHSDRNGGNLNILLKLLTFSVTGLA